MHHISFLFQMVVCQVGNNSRAWRRGAGIWLVFKMKDKKKKKKGASFYKHFSENSNSVWDQFSPGAKDRINRQHMKATKVWLLQELHSCLHLKLNFKIHTNITVVVHICSPSGFLNVNLPFSHNKISQSLETVVSLFNFLLLQFWVELQQNKIELCFFLLKVLLNDPPFRLRGCSFIYD